MILLATPALPDTTQGNGVTAARWAAVLESLGHQVQIAAAYVEGDHSMLVALHARRSADVVRRFHAEHPRAPIVVALTGTDLYPDLSTAGVDSAILTMASRLVVLQPEALRQLGSHLAARTRVIIQSVPPIPARPPRTDCFEVALLAHLRSVKDPLLAAAAARLLPADSSIRITHLGEGRDPALASAAAAETAGNPRYDWLGAHPREHALAVLARSRLLVLTSRDEGGANVISEALAAGVPVLCSRIPGSVGLLGANHPGYFPPGDAAALARSLDAVEREPARQQQLRDHCASLRPLVQPERERQAWSTLLAELEEPVLT